MRLVQIKLAGFKSFVDPTVIATASQLVGVVGPNGCGKSNIVDAVRWVLGESRASELRGDSMQDVIFNGSSQRRPASRASVELVFDNSSQRLVGQWGAYSEVAIRRVLTRDATSTYFINGQVVRRRDVHDVFLGTGLGARGYAIIGQGTINRLIEARPEELRVYLEEAAGVSRYKARRRETENRLAGTRENLSRLEDLLGELERQSEKLQQQAQKARRYQQLQEELQQLRLAFYFAKLRQAQTDQTEKKQQITQLQNQLEAKIAQLRTTESQLELQRQQQQEEADNVHKLQGLVFEVGAQLSRHEADLRHQAEAQQRFEQQLAQLRQQSNEWQQQAQHCEEELKRLQGTEVSTNKQLESLQKQTQEAKDGLPLLQQKLGESAAAVQLLRDQLSQLETQKALREQAASAAARYYQASQLKLQQLSARLAQLPADQTEKGRQLENELAGLQLEKAEHSTKRAEWQARLDALQKDQDEAEKHERRLSERLHQLRAQRQALKALQQHHQEPEVLKQWLAKHNLADTAQLWQQIRVAAGWETAVEAVLRERITALEVSETALEQLPETPPPSRLMLYAPNPNISSTDSQPGTSLDGFSPLMAKVETSQPLLLRLLHDWLSNYFAADNLASALAQRHLLMPGMFYVVAEGHLVGSHELFFYSTAHDNSGYLKRRAEIESLEHQVDDYQQQYVQIQQTLQSLKTQLETKQEAIKAFEKQQAESRDRRYQTELELNRWRQQSEQAQEQRLALQSEIADLTVQVEEALAEQEQALEEKEALTESHQQLEQRLQQSRHSQQALQEQVNERQQQLNESHLALQQAQFERRAIDDRTSELRRNLDLARHHLQRSATEIAHLETELADIDVSEIKAALELALLNREEHEETLRSARQALEATEARLREHDQQRLLLEQSLEPRREEIMAKQLQEQEARLAVEQYQEQLRQAKTTEDAVEKQLSDKTENWRSTEWLQTQQTRLQQQLEQMGPVNLAALEELSQTSERLEFLRSQQSDLLTAISTLEDAIRKIDRETRQLLQNTFDVVNSHFGDLFPKLFGGGRAYLEMTGDEILDAGVLLMAQPPGKRNSSIQLLSGGEKALSAIALVFAFFKLNPAPFCLLDEVDAPLDDANTGRYTDLVRSMSDQTQFFFVTHNKIAMQMAKQLIGVTMQEQGVSRIVAVDIDTAVEMAAL
ncbi:MAG TPA: chromosome segregation protein SMC [Burkholderiaceae bacterium]|nr:chromosome segregation protein SMC [Burkholderiaceae bacterium]